MKPYLFAPLLILLLTACNSGPVANDAIDAGLRKTIAANNEILVDGMWRNPARSLKRLGTERFNEKDADEAIGIARAVYFQPDLPHTYTVVDEYYSEDNGGGEIKITSEKYGFSYTFRSNRPECYISVLKIHPNEQQDYLVFALYNKNEGKGDWKLDKFLTARYAFYGKNAADMLALAQKWEKKGFTIDALIHSYVAYKLTVYGGKDLKFDINKEIAAYHNDLLEKVHEKYGKLPFTINSISTHPQIADFDMAFLEGKFYPTVHYITGADEYDIETRHKEYEAVKNYVKRKMPDLASNQRYVIYRTFAAADEYGELRLLQAFMDENKGRDTK